MIHIIVWIDNIQYYFKGLAVNILCALKILLLICITKTFTNWKYKSDTYETIHKYHSRWLQFQIPFANMRLHSTVHYIFSSCILMHRIVLHYSSTHHWHLKYVQPNFNKSSVRLVSIMALEWYTSIDIHVIIYYRVDNWWLFRPKYLVWYQPSVPFNRMWSLNFFMT